MVLSWNKNLILGSDVIRLFRNITLLVSLSKRNCKICSIYNYIIDRQSFVDSSKHMTTIFPFDAQNAFFIFKLIIGLMYFKRKAAIWPYSNFTAILYKR